jgi:hypothetical protein
VFYYIPSFDTCYLQESDNGLFILVRRRRLDVNGTMMMVGVLVSCPLDERNETRDKCDPLLNPMDEMGTIGELRRRRVWFHHPSILPLSPIVFTYECIPLSSGGRIYHYCAYDRERRFDFYYSLAVLLPLLEEKCVKREVAVVVADRVEVKRKKE